MFVLLFKCMGGVGQCPLPEHEHGIGQFLSAASKFFGPFIFVRRLGSRGHLLPATDLAFQVTYFTCRQPTPAFSRPCSVVANELLLPGRCLGFRRPPSGNKRAWMGQRPGVLASPPLSPPLPRVPVTALAQELWLCPVPSSGKRFSSVWAGGV